MEKRYIKSLIIDYIKVKLSGSIKIKNYHVEGKLLYSTALLNIVIDDVNNLKIYKL